MDSVPPRKNDCLAGGGEMGALMRALDWSRTSLGPMSGWPDCLTSAVSLMLPARAQIVMFWGPEFVALYNDAYAVTIGAKHPGALGRPARENWAELWDDLEPLLQSVRRTGETVHAKDRPFSIERHGYLETVYFDISYSPVRDDTGAVAGVLCIVCETTDRVLAQRALRESEERLRALIAQATVGMAQTDGTGRFTMVNQRYCDIVGYSEDELLQMRMHDLAHPEDQPGGLAQFRELVESAASFVVEERYVRKDGSLIWVSNSVAPIRDAAGRVQRAVATVVDMTERRRAEEIERRLAAIVEFSNDAIVSKTLDGIITSWNAGAERLFGYSAGEAVGRPVTILIPEDRLDEEPGIIERIRSGQRVESYDTVRRRKDGTAVEVSLMVSPIRNAQGTIIGASKIARDITERKAAERLQRVLMHELKHRVKNVLATVMAIARQTFKAGRNNDARIGAFEARLLAMSGAHDLLTRKNWDSVDLSDVVVQALAPYRPDGFDIQGPPLLLAPRIGMAMTLALHELATNAAKYGALSVAAGKVSITWSLAPDDPQQLTFCWEERGGPLVSAPKAKGFGSLLIERNLASELAGDVKIIYNPSGVMCVVRAPLADASHAGEEAA